MVLNLLLGTCSARFILQHQLHMHCSASISAHLKEKIIHESLKLFSLKGFLSTSLQDILEAAHTSKGGFYNHFQSKEDLFFQVLNEAKQIWREKNLEGLDQIEDPIGKTIKLLENFRDRYLKDSDNFPGGCVFITLSVELNNQCPGLSKEINKGFAGFKRMFKSFLDHADERGDLKSVINTNAAIEILLNSVLGISVNYSLDKSDENLNNSIIALIDYVNNMRNL